MNSKSARRLAVAVTALATLGACASTPLYGGSHPVGGSVAYNNGYPPPPSGGSYGNGGEGSGGYGNGGYGNGNGGYGNGGYGNSGYGNGQYASQAWGTVTRVESVGGRQGGTTGLGAVIGAGVGAIAGNQIGRSMNDAKTTGTVVGAIGGGVIGNAIERNQNRNAQAQRVYVRLDDGSEHYWDVAAGQFNAGVGQRVRIEGDQLYAN